MQEEGFVRVGATDDFRVGRGRAVRCGESQVAVFRTRDGWFALQDACPHMGASLAEGRLDGGAVVCAWHDRRFDLCTGRTDSRSGKHASAYEVRVVEGAVWVRPAPARA